MEQFDFIKLFKRKLAEKTPNWYVKGLIDSDNNLITLGTDSKLIGRIFELKSNGLLQEISDENEGYELKKPQSQTEYPDYYYECPGGKRIAVDIKTTYLDSHKKTIKYTLGSYTSYLQDKTKNINGTYDDYKAHYVIGFVYDRLSNNDGVILPYSKENLDSIEPAYGNVRVWVQEKYKIVGLIEGSGNTANIGSISRIKLDDFIAGNGPFSTMDERICENYWKHFKKNGPYKTVEKYFEWARENSELTIDFAEQEEKYIAWRRENNPTNEDLLLMALRVIHARGARGREKGLWVELSDGTERIAKKEPQISDYILFCNSNNIAVIEEMR